jgi:hypothetical protein
MLRCLQGSEQTGHLLEVGGHIWVVAAEMDIVELNVDDVLDAVAEIALRQRRLAERGGEQSNGREKPTRLIYRVPPISVADIPASHRARGTYPATVTDRGHEYYRIMTPALRDCRRRSAGGGLARTRGSARLREKARDRSVDWIFLGCVLSAIMSLHRNGM